MAVKRFNQTFQTDSSNARMCADTPNWGTGSAVVNRSQGATAVIGGGTLPQTPRRDALSSPPYKLISMSVTAYLGLAANATSGNIPYGLFGRIVAGTDPNAVTPFGGFVFGANSQPWSVIMEPFPPDPSLVSEMWNPANDPMPPAIAPYSAVPGFDSLLPITAVISPPVPITLPGTNAPYVGIWMTPSLYGAPVGLAGGVAGMMLFYGNSVLTYDDGT